MPLECIPTRFGPLPLEVKSQDGVQVEIDVNLDSKWPRRPEKSILHLPAASQILINGQTSTMVNGTVSLPAGSSLHITVNLERRR
jgi:hypothetical protein